MVGSVPVALSLDHRAATHDALPKLQELQGIEENDGLFPFQDLAAGARGAVYSDEVRLQELQALVPGHATTGAQEGAATDGVGLQLPFLQLFVQAIGLKPLPRGLTGADHSAYGHHGGADALEAAEQLQCSLPLSLLLTAGDGRVAQHHVLLDALRLEGSEVLKS